MLDTEKVLELFSLFSDLEGEDLERWRFLCGSAAARTAALTREGINPEDHQERLCAAAGALAYCDYLLLGESALAHSGEIRVGAVALKDSSGGGPARKDALEIRDYFLAQAADLLQPEEFAFRQAGGETT